MNKDVENQGTEKDEHIIDLKGIDTLHFILGILHLLRIIKFIFSQPTYSADNNGNTEKKKRLVIQNSYLIVMLIS